ncbi:unnamed protein product, partial [Owenia fusiformis]
MNTEYHKNTTFSNSLDLYFVQCTDYPDVRGKLKMADVFAKFVSQKISKIRWCPASDHSLQRSDVFATGSWDNKKNHISLWQVNREESETALEPQPVSDIEHNGDVTDLAYVNGQNLVSASSRGTITCYRQGQNKVLKAVNSWDNIHHHSNKRCSCTAIATKNDGVIATVGEDGRIHILNIEQRDPVRTINNADSSSMNGVAYLKQFEIVTVNSIGQLKVWDLRQPDVEPRIFVLTGERTPLHCVSNHPNQPHIVATGGQDGKLNIWDMRQEKFPVTILDGHDANMWELKFHPTSPD